LHLAVISPVPSKSVWKHLTSPRSDRTTRDRAVSALRTFLKRNAPLTETECLKLWKGLYYTMWMSDKPRNQQQLARDLADLVHVLPTRENFLVFVDGFWQTMSREWPSIDALRMDKFLYLVRCYVQEGFQYVRRTGWNEELVDAYMGVLEATPFELRSVRISNGLRYHVVDLYVDELDKADQDSTSPVEKLIAPMKKMAKDSPNKTARKRATEALDDARLARWKSRKEITEESEEEEDEEEEEEEEEGEDGEFGGFDD
jgi:ribosomal RNA-processing protein 1